MGQVARKCIKRCTVSLLPGKDYLKRQSSNTTETTRKGVEERPSRSREETREDWQWEKKFKHRATNSVTENSLGQAF